MRGGVISLGGKEPAQFQFETVWRNRLRQTNGERVLCRPHRSVFDGAADDQYRQFGTKRTNASEKLAAFHAGHGGICDHSIQTMNLRGDDRHAVCDVLAGDDKVANSFKDMGKKIANGAIILYNKDGGHAAKWGNRIQGSTPAGGKFCRTNRQHGKNDKDNNTGAVEPR